MKIHVLKHPIIQRFGTVKQFVKILPYSIHLFHEMDAFVFKRKEESLFTCPQGIRNKISKNS